MSKLMEVKKTIIQFLDENFKGEALKVVRLEKVDNNWKGIAEVYEDDSFLKAMNLPSKKTRNFYAVQVDEDLEVIAFERVESDLMTEEVE